MRSCTARLIAFGTSQQPVVGQPSGPQGAPWTTSIWHVLPPRAGTTRHWTRQSSAVVSLQPLGHWRSILAFPSAGPQLQQAVGWQLHARSRETQVSPSGQSPPHPSPSTAQPPSGTQPHCPRPVEVQVSPSFGHGPPQLNPLSPQTSGIQPHWRTPVEEHTSPSEQLPPQEKDGIWSPQEARAAVAGTSRRHRAARTVVCGRIRNPFPLAVP